MMRKITFLFSVLLMALTACSNSLIDRSVEVVNGTQMPAKKVLGMFYPIEGTQYQIASIVTTQGESGGRSYDLNELFSSGRSDTYGVYNYVFLDMGAETVYAVLPTNEHAILSLEGYPVPKAEDLEKTPIAWWLYTVVKADTNQDKQFSYADKKTLAISDVGGQGYTEVITDVDQILADVFKEGNALLVIYRANDKNFLAHVDLAARKVTKTTELPSFGEDVK